MYGWRARLGVLVPSVILATEPEFREMTPEGVSCHYHRISFQGGGIDNLKKVEEGLEDATRIIMHVHPMAMAMSVSMWRLMLPRTIKAMEIQRLLL